MTSELDFAELLRRQRQRAGLSQYELALRCGMRAESIGRLERGQRDPRLTTLARLARGLGITASELLTPED